MKFKKLAAVLAALSLMGSSVPLYGQNFPQLMTISVSAAEETYEDFTVTVDTDSNTAQIVKYTGEATEIAIPDNINGVPVRAIQDEAFRKNQTLTSIIIPDTVRNIGYSAFRECSALESIIIPDTVTSIGNYIFASCENLKSVKLPTKIKTIPEGAFYNCSVLEEVIAPEGITTIGYAAFSATGLQQFTIPETVTMIDGYAFSNSHLTSITIPKNVENLCSHKSGNVPWGEQPAFGNCKYLETVIIEEGVQTIEARVFKDCTALKSVTIPSTATLQEQIFQNCTSLTDVHIAEGAQILSSALSANGKLFDGCSSLETIQLPESFGYIPRNAFQGCSSLKNIKIPTNFTIIQEYAFFNCSQLTEIDIPENITSVKQHSFDNCSRLDKIIFRNPNCTIYDRPSTIYNYALNDTCYFDGTIYGYADSTAQKYAEKYGYAFELIDNLPTETEPDTTEPSAIQSGDINEDQNINIMDVIFLNKAIYGKANLSEEQAKAADVNKDGKPDATDSLLIMKYIIHLIDNFD